MGFEEGMIFWLDIETDKGYWTNGFLFGKMKIFNCIFALLFSSIGYVSWMNIDVVVLYLSDKKTTNEWDSKKGLKAMFHYWYPPLCSCQLPANILWNTWFNALLT
jgi:hypothetical protein